MTKTLSKHTETLVALLNEVAGQPVPGTYPNQYRVTEYRAMPGKDRDRIFYVDALVHAPDETPDFSRSQRFVRCFVDRNSGTIYYSQGWTSPAKWGGVLATEFSGDEFAQYAEFTKDRGWGYKGDRAKWEARKEEAAALA